MKILLLEDDVILQEIVEEHLIYRGFNVDCYYNGNDALKSIEENIFDLLLLDVNVAGINGFLLLKEVRKSKIQTPALFITALQSASDLQNAFEIGADDYIRKPFELAELDARIDNVCRRYNMNTNNGVQISENILFFVSENRVEVDGSSTKLSQMQSEILNYLVKQKNRVVSQDELTVNLWDYEHIPDAATIRTYMKELRRIIGKERIVTIRNQGYKYE